MGLSHLETLGQAHQTWWLQKRRQEPQHGSGTSKSASGPSAALSSCSSTPAATSGVPRNTILLRPLPAGELPAAAAMATVLCVLAAALRQLCLSWGAAGLQHHAMLPNGCAAHMVAEEISAAGCLDAAANCCVLCVLVDVRHWNGASTCW